MDLRVSGCQGCLLGLAVGDAMGYTVDEKSWEEIREDYGPNGLLGYDLVNGCAAASAYTQVAAFAANGLLLGITRGRPELYPRYLELSLREWARAQFYPRDPEPTRCWVAKVPQMRVRLCKDSRMLEALRMERSGTMEKPVNRASSTGSLTGAVVAGMAGKGISFAVMLGAQCVALTHGNVETFLCGSVLAGTVAGILEDRQKPLAEQYRTAIDGMCEAFAQQYPQAQELADRLRRVIHKAQQQTEDPRLQMEAFGCDTAQECLCGAIYASLVWQEDFDSAMILAVNHSGRSAVVGALTGAILGAAMGAQALPDFYLEGLENLPVLQVLAEDLALGSPTSGLFNDDWDQKYVQGQPVGIAE